MAKMTVGVSRTRKALFVVVFALLLGGGIAVGRGGRPAEGELIERFKTHEAGYRQLRDMLLEDTNIVRVADWGVERAEPPFIVSPPVGMTRQRYDRYLALLAEVGGLGASRSRPPHPIACILVWADGWAGDAQHASVCWRPSDGTAPSRPPHGRVFRQIVDRWYLEED